MHFSSVSCVLHILGSFPEVHKNGDAILFHKILQLQTNDKLAIYVPETTVQVFLSGKNLMDINTI
jgi:hypothetical protein